MKRILLVIGLMVSCYTSAQAQEFAKSANDAFIITRMAAKFHFHPRAINDSFSSDVFTKFINGLDNRGIIFTREDISSFENFRYNLDEEINHRQLGFLEAVESLYKKRLTQVDTMIDNICKNPFNFYTPEKLTATEDTSFAKNLPALHTKLYKLIKLDMLEKLKDNNDTLSTLSQTQQKKYIEQNRALVQKRIRDQFKRIIRKISDGPGGVQQMMANEYCKAIAACFDPHTEYFSLTAKEQFEDELGQKNIAFGFSLKDDENGEIVIDELTPGSPAFKSGQVNRGDKIESVQWGDNNPVNVDGASLQEISEVLDASNHDKAVLILKKADGTTRKVTLGKEKLNDDIDENKVKSFLLKGNKSFGYISLPAFYQDWENTSGVNGCANDVAKEIIKLKKENMEGLILDLRYNGGGSVQEAIELAGIFIDAGPVGQFKTKDDKVITLKDINRGTIYDGPLILLVNGYSASASEILAGTLQDYNRAVIVGSPTYGKATSQIILPLDTTVTEENYTNSKADSYMKITDMELYRVSGKTAQASGVTPDILVPDALEVYEEREADNPLALPGLPIDANKYYKPLPAVAYADLNKVAAHEIETSDYFIALTQYVKEEKKAKENKDISLLISDAISSDKSEDLSFTQSSASDPKLDFTVQNNKYDMERINSNISLQEINEEWQKHVSSDPYTRLAYKLLMSMVK